MSQAKTVLVLCTGNSCRSQMGEAILNHELAGLVRGISAGTNPQARVADGAIEALRLAGLPTDGLFPKTVEDVMDQDIDLVVSVCDNARETCPVFPRPVKRIHVGFHDPHGEPLESFLAVRDDIRRCLPKWPAARIQTLYNRIDVEALQGQQVSKDEARDALGLSPDEWVVGNVGRLHPDKDQATLLKGFALALAQLPAESKLAMKSWPVAVCCNCSAPASIR